MMLKRRITLLLCVGIVLITAGCKAQAAPVYAEGVEKDQVALIGKMFASNILGGIQENDYDKFSFPFDAQMKAAMTQDQFDKIVKMYGPYGAYKSFDLINVEILDPYYRLNYQVNYENKVVIMLIVIPQSGTAAVSGLWFK